MPNRLSSDVRVLVLLKNDERYVLCYTQEQRSEALRQLGRWASDAELSFTWYDAAVMNLKIRAEKQSV